MPPIGSSKKRKIKEFDNKEEGGIVMALLFLFAVSITFVIILEFFIPPKIS